MRNRKGQSGKVGLIVLLIVALFLIGLLVIMYISDYRDEMKQDVVMIESIMFAGNQTPNQTMIDNCNYLYNESKPQTYFPQMYDCLKEEITLEKIEVTIPYENLTSFLLDTQCECIEEGRKNCKIYKCGVAKVWGKL